jgi:hypothetical protein
MDGVYTMGATWTSSQLVYVPVVNPLGDFLSLIALAYLIMLRQPQLPQLEIQMLQRIYVRSAGPAYTTMPLTLRWKVPWPPC